MTQEKTRQNDDESRRQVIAIPFGQPLIAVVIAETFLFPGTMGNVTISNPSLVERVKKDRFALTVYPNPDTGIASGIATLVALEQITPLDNGGSTLVFNALQRARITDIKHIPGPSDSERLSELLWELLDDEEIPIKRWNQQDVKGQTVSLLKAMNEILDRAPHAIEQHRLTVLKVKEIRDFEQARYEKIIGSLVAAVKSLKRARRELFGITSDITASVLCELYYALKDSNPRKEVNKLVSNIFHTVMAEERLRRLGKFAEWLVLNWELILDDEEADGEEMENEDVAAGVQSGGLSSNALALFERYRAIKHKIPEESQKEIERGLVSLNSKPSNESAIMERLTWIVSLPWEKCSVSPTDLREVKRILNEDHFGLERVKDRILEYLAVHLLSSSAKGKVLCFVGPKGVGKTSLGKSIARSLGKKFVRFPLGGMDDASDLRGHHYTYHNAAPGFIIRLIRMAGERDCVFMLDEIDKVGKNWKGDPSSVLLAVLDPEQNNQFNDHYLGIPFDLSEILFIATANIIATIHATLQDRLEILEIPGYTSFEKLNIAKHYLIPRLRVTNGFPVTIAEMNAVDIEFSDGAILNLINCYTREAGVRNLERELDRPFRKVAKQIVSQEEVVGTIEVTEENVEHHCGRPKFTESEIPEILPVATVPVLAVSETGGFLYMVEITIGRHPNGRKIAMKGVRESGESKDAVNKIAESLEKVCDAFFSDGKFLFGALKEIEDNWKCTSIIEGNITNGTTPKDGPSAGLSIFLAVYGAIFKKSIKPRVEVPLIAATGEIEVNLDVVGKIGGLRDKILAASRQGVKLCLVPKANETDLEDIPEEVRRKMKIVSVENRWEAVKIAYPEDREKIDEFLSQRNRSS